MASTKEVLLRTLEDLGADDFEKFKWFLQQQEVLGKLPPIPKSRLENADRRETVDLMVERYSINAFEVARMVLKKMGQNDLMQKLSNTNSGPADSCELTIDTNTVNKAIKLSNNNRKMTCVRVDQPYPDHPDRFDTWMQLLCRTGLTGRCYWEVKWRGRVFIAVSYRGISRKADGDKSHFGHNKQSWRLFCSEDGEYNVRHNNRETLISPPSSFSSSSNKVGVCVDWPAGTLSFYSVSSGSRIHLHTFNTTFTEPLYPGFGLHYDSSVSLCSV